MSIKLNDTILAFAGSGSHELTFTYDEEADTNRSQVSITFSAAGMENITNSYRAYYHKNGTGGLRFAFPKIDDSGSNLNKPVTISVDDSSITVYQIANPTLTLYGGLSKEETYSANTTISADRKLIPIGGEIVVNNITLGDNDYYLRGNLTFDQPREMDAIEWAHLKLFSGTKGTIDSGRIYNDYLWDPKGRNFICCFDDPSLFKGDNEIMRLEVIYYTRKKYLGHETYLLKRGW